MEEALQELNRRTITLSPKDVKRNNEIIHPFLEELIDAMKLSNDLFDEIYEKIFYGGSYYDGVRIKKPDEFDLVLYLRISKCEVVQGEVPGHVKVKLDPKALDDEAMQVRNLFADSGNFLLTSKFNAWFKSVVHKALNHFKITSSNKEYKIAINDYKLNISVHDHGPAENLVIRVHNFTINIDLVPCILFPSEDWPVFVRKNPVKLKADSFSVAAKSPKKQLYGRAKKRTRYWRLSFQEQEHYILQDKQLLKPCLKLLKLLRDSQGHHQIVSYYLKIFMLNLNDKYDADFWNRSLSNVFMDVLEEYVATLKNRTIKHYWIKQYNLLDNVEQLDSITRSTERIFNRLRNTNDPKRDVFDCFKA